MADHEPPATPPGNAENSADTPPPLPERIRVHALAKLLGVTSKRLLAHLTEMGSEARTAHSSVNRDVAESVRESLTEAQQAVTQPAEPPGLPAQVELAEPAAPVEPAAEAEPQPAELESATDVAHATLFSSPVVTEPAPVEPVEESVAPALQTPLFLPPETTTAEPRRRRRATAAAGPPTAAPAEAEKAEAEQAETAQPTDEDEDEDNQPRRRRRGRRGRGRGRGEQATGEESTEAEDSESESGESESAEAEGGESEGGDESAEADEETETDEDEASAGEGPSRRRRRRRRRKVGGETAGDTSEDDPPNTVVHEREPRTKAKVRDEVQGITGSTRLEAKRQRRRDGRDAGRRRPPILSESEFLARREAVDRVMVVREKAFFGASEATGNVRGASEATGNVRGASEATGPDLATTQVAVLEDGVLVEHFVTSVSSASIVGNVYRGRVQNVLPSMEAAFVDIGRGRNGVLYAGEVNWEAAGLGGKERKIEQALKPGDQVLVQVSKDPVGHKGARLTTQISLAGRFLVYVPGGSSTGISRKLPDTERKRLKEILREIVPADAGVIIRTASEGVSAEELARDVERLQNQWRRIESDANGGNGNTNPQALYEEPDLLVKVVRDLFNEDFSKLVIEGDQAWNTIESYIRTVAPDLLPRVQRHESPAGLDVFETHRIDEQLAKALERKVWLPSGGTLVIDRTEAMTVVDVNTGKFTGAGGNLEETVTRNNLEAAEEIVRQMRLRDIGGMIVVDFIDMVLESNRDLVLRRLTECLGRDRTRHQVSEVTSLGLVQMTRKKLGTGLVEAFSTTCEHCHGRGIVVHSYPVDATSGDDSSSRARSGGGESGGRRRRGRDRTQGDTNGSGQNDLVRHVPEVDVSTRRQHPVALAMAAHHAAEHVQPDAEQPKVEDEVAAEAAESVGAEAVQVEAVDTVEVTSVEVAADVETVAVETLGVEDAAVLIEETTAPVEESHAPVTPTTAPDGETTAPDGDATPAAPHRTGRRRVSRAAAAPEGDSRGTVVVISAEEESGDGRPSEVATALRAASVIVPPRSRRRRASGRPAGPPVDVEA